MIWGHIHLSEQLFQAIFMLSLYLEPFSIWSWGIHFSKVMKSNHVIKCPFTSVLAKNSTSQDLYKQPATSGFCEHSCMDLSGGKNFRNESAFYLAVFQDERDYNRQCTFCEGVCIFRESFKLWNTVSGIKLRSEVELRGEKKSGKTCQRIFFSFWCNLDLKKKVSSIFKIKLCVILQHSNNYFYAVTLSLHH